MKLAFFVARRYLFSQKKRSVINAISWISLIGIAIGTMALIVVLSVYNGIGDLTQSLFNVFDPELKIEAKKGKTFDLDSIPLSEIEALENVKSTSAFVEENMWITYKEKNKIVTMRGVDDNYHKQTGIDTLLFSGKYELKTIESNHYIVMGVGSFFGMGINSYDAHTPVGIHIPKRNSGIGFSFENTFNSGYALPTGSFRIQGDIDDKYVIADIDFTRQLMNYSETEVSALSVAVKNKKNIAATKENIQTLLGDNYTVKDRFEQQPLYYKIFKSEKIGVFLVLSLIVLIATLNLISSLSLLIIDKHKDIKTLQSMGANKQLIKKIFFCEGILISLWGTAIGLGLGFIVCIIQQKFGIIKMGSNFVVDSFPVSMQIGDFVAVFLMVGALSVISVLYTIRRAKI